MKSNTIFILIVVFAFMSRCGEVNTKTDYDQQRKVKLVYQVNEEGIKNGIEKVYDFSDVLIETITWKDGVMNGTYTSYYESGNPKLVVDFVDNLKSGVMTGYYENGAVESKCDYIGDKPSGVYESFYTSGKRRMRAIMRNDTTVCFVKQDELSGNIIEALMPINEVPFLSKFSYSEGYSNKLYITDTSVCNLFKINYSFCNDFRSTPIKKFSFNCKNGGYDIVIDKQFLPKGRYFLQFTVSTFDDKKIAFAFNSNITIE